MLNMSAFFHQTIVPGHGWLEWVSSPRVMAAHPEGGLCLAAPHHYAYSYRDRGISIVKLRVEVCSSHRQDWEHWVSDGDESWLIAVRVSAAGR